MTTFGQVSLILFCFFLITKTEALNENDNNKNDFTNNNSVSGLEMLIQNEFLNKQIGDLTKAGAAVASAAAAATSSTNNPSTSRCSDNDALYKYMDNLAIKLKEAISNRSSGTQLLRELQEAINMVDLLKVAGASAGKMVSVETKQTKFNINRFKNSPGGLLDALNEDDNNEHIVHSIKKLSEEGLKELELSGAGFGESVSIEKYMQFLSDPKWIKHNSNGNGNSNSNYDKNKSEKIQAVKDFLINGFNKGANLVDQLYMTASFAEQIPIIGLEISKLKKKGQFVYDIIKTVRSLKTFMEIYKSGQQYQVKLSNKGKKMLGNAGIDALKYVAINMLKSYTGIDMNPGNINEIAGRTAYYLLIQFAPQTTRLGC